MYSSFIVSSSFYHHLQICFSTGEFRSSVREPLVRKSKQGEDCAFFPPIIDVLKGGFPESQEHAAGALFSLALDDQNKTAIGVLGALPPLQYGLGMILLWLCIIFLWFRVTALSWLNLARFSHY